MSFEKLVEGFRRFQSDYFNGDSELFQKLIMDGQSPEALVIACSDSRIDPGIITQAEPGDIFSVRNVAAMVPPYSADSSEDGKHHGTTAAIEYAVNALKVQYIIVMGHALCGGIRALAESGDDLADKKDPISSWISIGSKARDMVRKTLPEASIEEQARVLEQTSILVSLQNLMTFPTIKAAVTEGRLQLHGWYFDIPNGKLMGYDSVKRKFKNILSGHMEPAMSAGCGCEGLTISVQQFLKRIKEEKGYVSTMPIGETPISIARTRRKRKVIEQVKQLAYVASATTAMAAISGGLDEIFASIGAVL